ncbi:MAG: AAA family ATPase [Solirubrobacterales bacterium]|nr:AAA family ATPase [Solirubrobacterales bacterium]
MNRVDGALIRLCGRFEAAPRGRDVSHELPGRQGRLLLAYLTCRRGRPVTRGELIDLLWPSDPPGAPDDVLGSLLSKLRRALGAGMIEGRHELTLVLPDGARVDLEVAAATIERAEAALAAGHAGVAFDQARTALELTEGGFLPGFDNPWVEERRREVEELRLRALGCVASAGVALGGRELAAAERAARQLISAAPLHELGYRLLMEMLAARGDVAAALQTYDRLRVTLRDELGIAPGPAARAVHERLLAGGDQAAPPASDQPETPEAPHREERKLVTVLTADVVPDKDPERSERWLERLRTAAAVEVQTRGGSIHPATGGGILVAFGVPVSQEDDAKRAVEFAHVLRDQLAPTIPVRIAVETGEVMVREQHLSGAPILTAARMLHGVESGQVLVGERASAVAERRARLSPFVGRAAELGALSSAASRLREERRPQLVTIIGDAGVGKSRLAREFARRLAGEASDVRVFAGRCLSYGRGLTYRALGEVLRAIRADEIDRGVERLAEREILNLTLGLEVSDELHPLAALDQLRAAWVELVAGIVRQRPAVIAIEDLHWAQNDLLDLLEQLAHDVDGPLMLLGTARPELLDARPSWGRWRDAHTLWLEPLGTREAAPLVRDVPAHLRDVVLARAEGNPFFLEELVAQVGEGDVVAATAIPDSIHAVLAARIDQLPPTEKQALQAASVIGRGFWREAVELLLGGVRPSFSLLEERDFIRPRPRSSPEAMDELIFKHALTCEVAYGSLSIAMRARLHAGFARWLEEFAREADEYASLLAHHYYMAVSPESADLAWQDRPEEYEQARRNAIAWLQRAAELAVARYEIDDGVALLEQALALERDSTGLVQLWRALGRANALKYDGERYWISMQRAIELCTDRTVLAELYAELAFETANRAGMWRQRPEREMVDGWIARALELSEPGSAARVKAQLALAYWNPEGAGDHPREATEAAERIGDPQLRSYAYDAWGITLFVQGRLDLGYQLEKRRFALLDQIADPEHIADIYYAPITASVWRGDFDEARQLARKHDEISRPLTPHHRIHGIAVLLEVEELAGDWNAIAELQVTAEQRVADNVDTPCVRNARSLLVCALANANLGRDHEAERLERAADDMQMRGFGHVLETPRLRLALLRGDVKQANLLLDEPLPDRGWHRGWLLLCTHAARLDALAALGRRKELEAWDPAEPGSYLEPFLLRALGTARCDQTLVQQAIDCFERLGLHWHASQTRVLVIS